MFNFPPLLKRLLLGVLALVAAFLILFLDVDLPGDPRSLGTVADIEALADRDDLNVLFILVDTLRAHHLGSYGYERDTSPTIDAMASFIAETTDAPVAVAPVERETMPMTAVFV